MTPIVLADFFGNKARIGARSLCHFVINVIQSPNRLIVARAPHYSSFIPFSGFAVENPHKFL